MTLETISENRSHGGVQGVYKHHSRETKTSMIFSVYVPAHETGSRLPMIWYLSGLTCTHANVTEKGEFRRACAELGLVFIAPDTSPRGEGVPGISPAPMILDLVPASMSTLQSGRLHRTTACGAT